MYLTWNKEDQRLDLGTKSSDLIVGDWNYHETQSMGDGFNAYALNLTSMSYDTKHLDLKTSDWSYIGSAFAIPMVGSKYTVLLNNKYQQ